MDDTLTEPFHLEEATIGELHEAIKAGHMTESAAGQAGLDRNELRTHLVPMRLPLRNSPMSEAVADPRSPSCYSPVFETRIVEFQHVDPDLFLFLSLSRSGRAGLLHSLVPGPGPGIREQPHKRWSRGCPQI